MGVNRILEGRLGINILTVSLISAIGMGTTIENPEIMSENRNRSDYICPDLSRSALIRLTT